MKQSKKNLSVVIPVHNSEATIGALCLAVMEMYGGSYCIDIILVNDGSCDKSDSICRDLHLSFPSEISYICLSRNFGEHSAVMAGLNHARGEICIVMDDDFQTPPDQISLLIAELDRGFDVVYASYATKRDGVFRNLASRIHNTIATAVLGKPADLYLSSFKAMTSFMVRQIVQYSGPSPYVDAIILRSTDSIGTVQVRHDGRAKGRSGYTLKKLASLWGDVMVGWSVVPIRILGILGLAMVLFSLLIGGLSAADLLDLGAPDLSEFERLHASMLFFRGVQLFATSLVGEYVGRLYLAVTGAPQFVIRDILREKRKPTAGDAPRVVSLAAGDRGARASVGS